MTTRAAMPPMTQGQAAHRHLLGRTAVLLMSKIAGVVLGVLTTVLLARKLGPTAFSTFALGLVLLQLGSILTDLGMSSLLVRESEREPSLQRALLVWGERVKLIAGTAVAVVLSGAAMLMVDGGRERIAVVAIVAALPLQAWSLGTAVMQQRLLLLRISAIVLTQSVVYVFVVGALYLADASLLGFALGYLVFAACSALLVSVATRRLLRDVRQRLSWTEVRRRIQDAVPLSLTAVVITIYYKIDSVLVYNLASPEDAGSYAVAYRFLDHSSLIPLTLSTLFLPLLTRRLAERGTVGEVVDEYVRLTLLVAVPAVGGGMLAAGPIIGIFGSEYAESVVLLRMLLPAFVPIALGYILANVGLVHGRARSQLRVAILALLVNVTLNIIFISRYGARAAAVVTVVTEVAVVAALYLTLRKQCALSISAGWFARLLAAAVPAAVCGVLLLDMPLLAAAVFLVMYAAGVVALRVVTPAELKRLRGR